MLPGGELDGALEGPSDGALDGEIDGVLEGPSDGVDDGELDRLLDRLLEGPSDGALDSELDWRPRRAIRWGRGRRARSAARRHIRRRR